VAHHDPIGLIAPNAGLAQLNERSRDIFRQIVEVIWRPASRRFAQYFAPDRVPLSPASVRNVMSDLEQLWADLRAAKKHLGRPVADRTGSAFFVDALMQVGDLTEAEAAVDPEPADDRRQAQSVEAAVGRSPDAAVGPDPGRGGGADREIQFAAQAYRIRAARAGAGAGVAGRRGRQVENRVLTLPPGVPSSALIRGHHFLNARIRGRTLAEARLELETALTQNRAELDQLTQR